MPCLCHSNQEWGLPAHDTQPFLKSPFSIPYSQRLHTDRFWPLSVCIMNSGLLMAELFEHFFHYTAKGSDAGWHFYPMFRNQLLKLQIMLCDYLLNNGPLYVTKQMLWYEPISIFLGLKMTLQLPLQQTWCVTMIINLTQ